MFPAHTACQRSYFVAATTIKRQLSNSTCHLGIQNHEFVSNRLPKRLQMGFRNRSKIDKTQFRSPKVSQQVTLWPTGSPKWSSETPERTLQFLKNDTS